MMSELLKALYDSSVPILGRLKVACYLWGQCDILPRGKNAFLLKWVCQELCLVYSKKKKAPPSPHTACKLWQFLSFVLNAVLEGRDDEETSVLNIHLFQGMGVVFSSTAAGIGGGDNNADLISCSKEALECLHHVLMLQRLPSVLSIFETLVSLLETVLELGVACLRTSQHQLLPTLFLTLESLLKYYIYLEGTQGNRKKVFSATCHHLLCPGIRLWSLLQEFDDKECAESAALITKGLEAVFMSLFNSDQLAEFSSTLSSSLDAAQGERKSTAAMSSTRVLFDVLDGLLQSENSQAAIEILPFFLNAFLLQNSKTQKVPKSVEFKFFIRVLHLLGIQDETVSMETLSEACPQDLSEVAAAYFKQGKTKKLKRKNATSFLIKFEVCRQCLELVQKYNVYQVVEDMASDGKKQTSYFKYLTDCIVKQLNPHNSSVLFDCISVLLLLNHHLVEGWLPLLWAIAPSTSCSRSSNNQLITTCFETYSKLRQLPLLFEKQLDTIKFLSTLSPPAITPLITPSSSALTPFSEHVLGNHIASLPPGQASEIFHLHIKYFQEQIPRLSAGEHSPIVVKMAVSRSVEVFSIFLSHLPPSLWSARNREKSAMLLVTLIEEVWPELMRMAKKDLTSETLEVSTVLPTASLLLLSRCCKLVASLHPLLVSQTTPPKWPLRLDTSRPKFLIPKEWSGLAENLPPSALYLMKLLAIQQLKFDALRGKKSSRVYKILDFVFSFEALSDPSLPWNGQPLSLIGQNYQVGHWNLVASELPYIYESCGEDHLKTIAHSILMVLVSDVDGRRKGCGVTTSMEGTELDERSVISSPGLRKKEREKEENDNFSTMDVMDAFLQSESFLEMRQLQELMVSCFMSSLKPSKSLATPLKKALKLCGGNQSEGFVEEFPAALTCVLQHGLDAAGEKTNSPCNNNFWKLASKWKMLVYLKIMKVLPVNTLSSSVLLRCLLAAVVYHVALVFLLNSSAEDEHTAESLSSLSDLTYVVMWLLHALVRISRGKRKKAKKLLLGGGEVDLLLKWWYSVSFVTHKHHQLMQGCDASISVMVAMEMTLGMSTTLCGYPDNLALLLVGDLARSAICRPPDVVGRHLLTLAEVVCRDLKAGRLQDHAPLGVMCRLLLDTLEQLHVGHENPSTIFTTHPHLVSTLAMVLNFDPHQYTSRAISLVDDLWRVGNVNIPLSLSVEGASSSLQHHEEVIALLDCFALKVCVIESGHHLPSPFLQEVNDETDADCLLDGDNSAQNEDNRMDVDDDNLSSDSGMSLASVWNRLKQTLVAVFKGRMEGHDELITEIFKEQERLKNKTYFAKKEQVMVERDGSELVAFKMIIEKLLSLLSRVLSAISRKEMVVVFEGMESEVDCCPSSVCGYCFCWLVLLDSKPTQENRTLIRPHLNKILLSCVSIAEVHSAKKSTRYLVAMAIQLADHVISIPSHVGVDDDAVILTSLQLCSFTSSKDSNSMMVLRIVEAAAEFLAAVIRQHAPTIHHTPGPFILATNKLLAVVVELGQTVVALCSGEAIQETSPLASDSVHCAMLLSRTMEMLSHQKSLYKFFAYIIHDFVVLSRKQPLHPDIQEVLLSGVFSLVKACNQPELAFLKASLETHDREAFLILMEEFNRSHRFGGRI